MDYSRAWIIGARGHHAQDGPRPRGPPSGLGSAAECGPRPLHSIAACRAGLSLQGARWRWSPDLRIVPDLEAIQGRVSLRALTVNRDHSGEEHRYRVPPRICDGDYPSVDSASVRSFPTWAPFNYRNSVPNTFSSGMVCCCRVTDPWQGGR